MITRPIARGVQHSNRRKISITLDPDTFDEIYTLAAKAKVNFTEQVRELIEWGMEATNVSE